MKISVSLILKVAPFEPPIFATTAVSSSRLS